MNGAHAFLGAYGDGALGSIVRPAMASGSLAAVRPGAAAVDSIALAALHVRLGGTLSISAPGGRRLAVRVAAIYDSARYRSPVPPVIISAADFLRAFRPPGADEVIIDAAPGVPAAASRAAVDAATQGDPLLTVQSLADYKAGLTTGISQVLDIVAALLGLAVLIALLGISTTLTLSVIERARESALLRALGLTSGQLRRMLLTEALLMAALAVILGVGLGTAFGVVMMHAVSTAMNNSGLVSLPYARIALYAAVSAAAALAAAVLPARKAARTSAVSAMADT